MKIAKFLRVAWFLLGGLSFVACEPAMDHEAKQRPYAPSSFFSNGALAQHAVDGTIDRTPIHENGSFYSGKNNGAFIKDIPVPLKIELLRRGQGRFNIYCAPCHSETADGHGMIVQHGFLAPPSFHTDEMRNQPAGFYFDVISNGYGAMFSYADRLTPEDRWAVISYIRALQLSQHFHFQDLSPDEGKILTGH